jgi:hypothetical protein
MGLMSGRPPNSAASQADALHGFWKRAGLQFIETRVIRIRTVYSDFDDYWRSNVVPIGPQGKLIAGMSPGAREELRSRLRDHLSFLPDGQIIYEAFANAVKGRVPV